MKQVLLLSAFGLFASTAADAQTPTRRPVTDTPGRTTMPPGTNTSPGSSTDSMQQPGRDPMRQPAQPAGAPRNGEMERPRD